MKFNSLSWISIFFFLLIALTPACVDLQFDEPPVNGEKLDVQANTTIADLKARYTGTPTEIADELIIRGVVVADDLSGNFFRSLIMQDESGGIEVLINMTSAHNLYPQGREVFINCQGLILNNNDGVIQLGGYLYEENGVQEVGDIAEVRKVLMGGEIVGEPAPTVKTINDLRQLAPRDISTLIKLENVEFTTADAGLSYADPIGRRSLNRTLVDCNGNEIVVRSSGFSTFVSELTPEGNGEITAIFSVFGTTPQLYIRGLSDVVMNGDRCTGVSGKEEAMTIREVRDLFGTGAEAAPANKKIKGIAISDNNSGNLDGRNLIIQDATAGIVVRFQDTHNFTLGEEVEVVISNQELSEFRGLLQVNFVANERAISLGSGAAPAPREATVREILDNTEAWESTLVSIKGAQFGGGGTYAGNVSVSDGTGTVAMFTRNNANFANESLPSSAVDLIAIVSQFDDPQIVLRNINDVDGGGGNTGGDPVEISLSEVRTLFTGGASSAPSDRKIRGVVISDRSSESLHDRNLAFQDASGGIIIRFLETHPFALGEELEINISGMELSEFNGLLQVNNVPVDRVKSFGAGTLPEPRKATVKEVVDNLESWESTLVKIENATITADGGTYSGGTNVTDASGTIVMFTRSQSTFASAALPSGMVTLTAIVSQFNDAQIIIRNLDDVKSQ